jgi:hypothetical protein
MNTHIPRSYHNLAVAILFGLAGVGLVRVAQGQPGGGGGGPAWQPGGGGLDNLQRTALNEAMQMYKADFDKLNSNLAAAQDELFQASLKDPFDEKLADEKAGVVAKTLSELFVLRSRALAAVAPTLKPEQQTQLLDTPMGGNFLTSGQLFMFGGGFFNPGGGMMVQPGGNPGGPMPLPPGGAPGGAVRVAQPGGNPGDVMVVGPDGNTNRVRVRVRTNLDGPAPTPPAPKER